MQMQAWEEFCTLSEDAQQRLLSCAVPRHEQRPRRGRQQRLGRAPEANAEAEEPAEDDQPESSSRRSRRRRRQRNTGTKLADGANTCQGWTSRAQ